MLRYNDIILRKLHFGAGKNTTLLQKTKYSIQNSESRVKRGKYEI